MIKLYSAFKKNHSHSISSFLSFFHFLRKGYGRVQEGCKFKRQVLLGTLR